MDLLHLTLTLAPQPGFDPAAAIPAWWGRAAHALLLDVVRSYDPPLATSLHDENAARPFAVSSLLGRFPQRRLDPQRTYSLRLAALRSDLAGLLSGAVQPGGPLAPGQVIELDYIRFSILPPVEAPVALEYAELGAAYLLAQQAPPRRLALELLSPTAFKSGGKHLPFPLPDLALGSLLERWNSFAPLSFPPETRRYAAECLAVSRYELATRALPIKSGGMRVGAVGTIQYASLNYDRYWMSVLWNLAAFAAFAGLGIGTTMGLGQARPLFSRAEGED